MIERNGDYKPNVCMRNSVDAPTLLGWVVIVGLLVKTFRADYASQILFWTLDLFLVLFMDNLVICHARIPKRLRQPCSLARINGLFFRLLIGPWALGERAVPVR